MNPTPGRRIFPDAEGQLRFAEGDYGRDPADGTWKARPPGFHLGSLADHEVVEHEDGTITVSPSIEIQYPVADGVKSWHGFLERGIWRLA